MTLPPAASDLLPAGDEMVRCAPHARAHEYDPGGTTIAASVLLVVELPPPWPKPVGDHPALRHMATPLSTRLGPGRLLAAVPTDPAELVVHRFDRTPAGAFGTKFRADDVDGVPALLESVVAIDRLPPGAVAVNEPTILVCTQGTHDVCCGIEGTRLAVELASNPSVNVLRVSHTGGHRFAPTAMTLPDGRMWANLDAATVCAIVERRIPTAEVASQCRGWWGAEPGQAQVAERAVFAEVGWEWDQTLRRIERIGGDDSTTEWDVTGDGRTWRVVVRASRTIPVLSCRAPGGTPAKAATEYAARIVRRP